MPVSRDGTAYRLTGPQDAPVVVLIHGLGLTNVATWPKIEPQIAAQYRVLGYDLLGHGNSLIPATKPNLTSLSNQLTALLDELEISQATLVGFSLGGMINRRVAIDHPDRVTGLCILNSPHERDPELQAKVTNQAKDANAGGPGATIDAALERWFTPEFHQSQPAEVANIRSVVLENEPTNYAHHREILATGVTELIRPKPPINLPALVTTCENDTGSTPGMSRAIAHEIPNASLNIVPGLRHLGLIERPEIFAKSILGFLATLHP